MVHPSCIHSYISSPVCMYMCNLSMVGGKLRLLKVAALSGCIYSETYRTLHSESRKYLGIMKL
jgi:hypothetical protein